MLDMRADDNKYLHRDFHLLADQALTYCGEKFGDEVVIEFLKQYVSGYYSPIINAAREKGLSAIKEWIAEVYEKEEASELLHTELSEDTLTVKIDKSPVIEYMKKLNQAPGKYYVEQTRTLYKVIADSCNFGFELKYYNDNGKTEFVFKK